MRPYLNQIDCGGHLQWMLTVTVGLGRKGVTGIEVLRPRGYTALVDIRRNLYITPSQAYSLLTSWPPKILPNMPQVSPLLLTALLCLSGKGISEGADLLPDYSEGTRGVCSSLESFIKS